MGKEPESNSLAKDETAGVTPQIKPGCLCFAWLASCLEWLNKHGPAVQTVIAVVMTWSLIQGCKAMHESHRTLLLTQQQFESTIEPVLDVSYGDGPTNGIIVTLKNVGTVKISDLRLIASACVFFNSDSQITNNQVSMLSELLADTLANKQSITYDFGKQKAENMVIFRNGGELVRAACYVLRYRRSVDMKPKFKLIMFFVGNDNFFMPVDSLNSRSTSASPFGNVNRLFVMKANARKFLADMEIPTAADN